MAELSENALATTHMNDRSCALCSVNSDHQLSRHHHHVSGRSRNTSANTHTHPFNGPLSWTTWVSQYQKDKTNLDFTEARDSEWQWHQLGCMQVCTSLQTDNHASTHHSVFYRPDALPATQPIVSEHWRDAHHQPIGVKLCSATGCESCTGDITDIIVDVCTSCRCCSQADAVFSILSAWCQPDDACPAASCTWHWSHHWSESCSVAADLLLPIAAALYCYQPASLA